MRSIGGGVVRFVGVAWVECPERTNVVGECTKRGTIEVLWQGTVMESFDTQMGDTLLVRDGATVARGAWLFSRASWSRNLRADLPVGTTATVRWSEPPVEAAPDEVTGLPRLRFPRGEGELRLELIDGAGVLRGALAAPRNAWAAVGDGAVVKRGQILATLPGFRRPDEGVSGIEALRSFLDGHVLERRYVAALAPCDGRIEGIETDRFTVRDDGDRLHVVRRRARSHVSVRTGDDVRAGDALDLGERSHHALLRIWGEERLAQHLVEELELETARRGVDVPRGYWMLVVRAMLAWRRVLRPGDTGLRRHQVLSRHAFERAQRDAAARGASLATAAPVLRGVAAMARERLLARDEGRVVARAIES